MAYGQVDRAALTELLRTVPYFATLDETVLEEIHKHIVIRRYDAGSQIFLRGDGSGEAPFYLVVDGSVRIYVTSLRGREQVLRHFHAGETFAEVPLFDGGAYPANADALTDATIAILPRQHLLQLMGEHPELAFGVVQVMAERLRHFNELVEDLSLRRVVSRVAHLLASEQTGHLTQAQMAAMIGTSREMVNRSLHSLEDESVIRLYEDGAITILDNDRLMQIIDEC